MVETARRQRRQVAGVIVPVLAALTGQRSLVAVIVVSFVIGIPANLLCRRSQKTIDRKLFQPKFVAGTTHLIPVIALYRRKS